MPAYHDIDNEPLHASWHLLTEELRDAWGFDGLIVADYVGVSLLHSHHGVAASSAEAAALSFNPGLDVELPGDECATHLRQALDSGLISMETIDEIVSQVLPEKMRLGLFEKPYTDEDVIALRTPAAVELAGEVAEQAVTTLDNNGVLPLSDSARIAVIGPTANDPLALLGDYAMPVHLINQHEVESTASVVTLLAGLQNACGEERVSFAQGCYIIEERGAGAPIFPGDISDNTDLDIASPLSTRLDLVEEAVAAAQAADITVDCVGICQVFSRPVPLAKDRM